MVEWLQNMTLDLMVFYAIAFVASVVLAVQVVMMVLGIGDDMDVDADAGIGDPGHPTGLHIFSLRSMTGFFGGFGWTGVIARESGLSVLAASGLGAVVGAILMLSVAYLMKLLYSLWESGTIDYQNAVGALGTVYMPIPPNLSGAGQIRVMVQGRLKVIPAYTRLGDRIPIEKKVKVVELLDPGTVLVEPLRPDTEKEKEAKELT